MFRFYIILVFLDRHTNRNQIVHFEDKCWVDRKILYLYKFLEQGCE